MKSSFLIQFDSSERTFFVYYTTVYSRAAAFCPPGRGGGKAIGLSRGRVGPSSAVGSDGSPVRLPSDSSPVNRGTHRSVTRAAVFARPARCWTEFARGFGQVEPNVNPYLVVVSTRFLLMSLVLVFM